MNKIIDNKYLHAEHKKWNSQLSLFQDEIETYENRLSEVVQKNSANDINKSIEHFQNQFIIQKANIDKLKNKIQRHEIAIAQNIVDNTITTNDAHFHSTMEEKMATQISLFKELKSEFYRFLTIVM